MNPQPYKQLMKSWLPLMIERFKCGHEKTPANTIVCTGKKEIKRCRACHNQAGLKWAQKLRGGNQS
jgi:hypothetical protein